MPSTLEHKWAKAGKRGGFEYSDYSDYRDYRDDRVYIGVI